MSMTIRERYLNDAVFHALVATLLATIERAEFTPTEIREAATQLYLDSHRRNRRRRSRAHVPVPRVQFPLEGRDVQFRNAEVLS